MSIYHWLTYLHLWWGMSRNLDGDPLLTSDIHFVTTSNILPVARNLLKEIQHNFKQCNWVHKDIKLKLRVHHEVNLSRLFRNQTKLPRASSTTLQTNSPKVLQTGRPPLHRARSGPRWRFSINNDPSWKCMFRQSHHRNFPCSQQLWHRPLLNAWKI